MTKPEYTYPTSETLRLIKEWPLDDIAECLKFIAKAWTNPELARESRPGFWVFVIDGSVHNRTLIAALMSGKKRILQLNSLSFSGGLYTYALTPEANVEMNRMIEKIANWAFNVEC